MAYRRHPSKSRKYMKSNSNGHSLQRVEENLPPAEDNLQKERALSHTEQSGTSGTNERKKSQPFGGLLSSLFGSGEKSDRPKSHSGLLSSLFGSGERAERGGKPIFTLLDFDIYLDDLLLAGLIILILSDKVEDEILLIILIYLLLDIF